MTGFVSTMTTNMKRSLKAPVGLILLLSLLVQLVSAAQWSQERANDWYRSQPWPVGCNFSPSTAINQLEMWQAETFDAVTIDRELGWAEQLGFNTVRVFLHNLLWTGDQAGFLKRMDRFLTIADKHHIKVIFVPLDAVWDPFPKLGTQREPKPHVHNSGWVQSPGVEILKDPARQDELKDYVQGVIRHFKSDRRVLAWDIFNEPDNMNRPAYEANEPANKPELSLMLLKKAFGWAREVDPGQPITSAVWLGSWGIAAKLSPMEKFLLEESDIITFHNYGALADMKECIANLKRYQRPIICTEYMARPRGSTFDPLMGYMQEQKVGALNWGFVAGKTQTIYPWDTWVKTYTAEPAVWFHDIFRKDGTPFDQHEVEYIKSVTKRTGINSK
ncbi:MAG: beta,4-xylanase [Pedosphaera sp.]|nr:beta,4-xylanase [Pedosphaera sp.]